MNYEYSLWTETTLDGVRYFWLVDEVFDDGQEKIIESGIELSAEAALEKIREYCPDAEE